MPVAVGVLGLLMSACGGAMVEEQQDMLGTDPSELCTNCELNREYYSDSTYTVWVGSCTRLCDGTTTREGVTSIWYQQAIYACY
jgi:hypothetical protein